MKYRTLVATFLLLMPANAMAQDGPGKIVFYRDSRSSDYKPAVFCDGAKLADVGDSEYLEVIAPPDRHPCVAESTLELPTYVPVRSGGTAYQKVEVTRGKDHHAFLVTSNEKEFSGQKNLKRLLIGQSITLPSLQHPGEQPVPEGVYTAGKNGVSEPRCVSCPDPHYTERGRRAKIQGNVVMEVIIGIDGKASEIRFIARLGLDMDEQSANAVRTWRFEPARGPDGQPVPVIVPIEITFRLL
jgi:TonB family protein